MLLLPFIYVPRLLEGDTQPWVLFGAVFALFTYRSRKFLSRRDALAIGLAVLALLSYVVRAGFTIETVRVAYILLGFCAQWVLANRGGHEYFRYAVRYAVALWFFFGLFQYISIQLGLPVIVFSERFAEGRSGVPSLTAEQSFYGSLSGVMAMYLLHDKTKGNGIFVAMAVLSVLLSGSLLALLLLFFPFLYLRLGAMVIAVAAFVTMVVLDSAINSGGLSARLAMFQSPEAGLLTLMLDGSLNQRYGQIEYTLYENLFRSLLFQHPIAFEGQFNAYAASTGILIPTGGNNILPMLGELVYNSGIFGLSLGILLIRRCAWAGETFKARVVRGGFALACLLNPVSIANPMFIWFVLQDRPTSTAKSAKARRRRAPELTGQETMQ